MTKKKKVEKCYFRKIEQIRHDQANKFEEMIENSQLSIKTRSQEKHYQEY